MPAKLTLNRPAGGKWHLAANPLEDKYHLAPTDAAQVTDTGLPVMLYGDTPEELCDLLFSDYTLSADKEIVAKTLRPLTISTNYTEADADSFAADAMEEVDGLLMRSIKHPGRDEWGLIVSTHILTQKGKNGGKRARLNQQMIDKQVAGDHRTQAEAQQQGWR